MQLQLKVLCEKRVFLCLLGSWIFLIQKPYDYSCAGSTYSIDHEGPEACAIKTQLFAYYSKPYSVTVSANDTSRQTVGRTLCLKCAFKYDMYYTYTWVCGW